jgi:hypothetical protein
MFPRRAIVGWRRQSSAMGTGAREVIPAARKTSSLLACAEEVFEGILEVRLEGAWWWSLGMTSDLILLRGFEQALYDLYDDPKGFYALMAFLRDENLAKLDFLESQGLLSLNNGGDFIGTGGYGWSRELPAPGFDGTRMRTRDLWGFCESQETSGVSPELFEEFVFAYQLPILERFGLNIYGCCEPLDSRWEIVRRIPRLRKVTVSPLSDVHLMAERLGGRYNFCEPELGATRLADHLGPVLIPALSRMKTSLSKVSSPRSA